MKLKNILQKLGIGDRYSVTDKFNKAASVGLPLATGYYIAGWVGTFFAGIQYAIGFGEKGWSEEASEINLQQNTIGVFDESNEIGRALLKTKRASGIEQDVDLLVLQPSPMQGPFSTYHDKAKIGFPYNFLESLQFEEVVAVGQHELGHIKANDVRALKRYGRGSLRAAIGNLAFGLVNSFAVFNPMPFLASIAAAVGARANGSMMRRNAERRADDFVIQHGDPKYLISGLLKITAYGQQEAISALAVKFYRERENSRFWRSAIGLAKKYKLPQPLLNGIVRMGGFFNLSHPPAHERYATLERAVQKKDPTFKLEPEVPSEVEICTSCAGAEDTAEQRMLTAYAKSVMHDLHGTGNVSVTFRDVCGDNITRRVLLPGFLIAIFSQGEDVQFFDGAPPAPSQ